MRSRAARIVVIALIAIGVVSGVARSLHPADLATRTEPMRARLWSALALREPDHATRTRDVQAFERRFAAAPFAIALHASAGALFLLLGAVQFVAGIRNRHPALHRWSGRLLLVTGFAVAATAVYFGMIVPVAGVREVVIIGLATMLFTGSLIAALIAIRKRRIAVHRKWMMRAFAVALGIAVMRVVAGVADATLTPLGYPFRDLFILSLALGWIIAIGAAELRIRAFTIAAARASSE
jgi:uncharacterized membrane protein